MVQQPVMEPTRRRFTVDEYHCMGQAGILRNDERVELLDGEIMLMPPIGSGHGGGVLRFSTRFSRRLGERVLVNVQNPLRLSAGAEPIPDIALLRPRDDFYATSHPGPEDVLLVVEVADTSLRYDRGTKLAVYAAANVAEVWIADLQGRRLLVYRAPKDGEYTEMLIIGRDGSVAPLTFPDEVFLVAELLD